MKNLRPLSDILNDAEIFTDGDWVESKDQDKNGNVRLTQLADIGDGVWINKSMRFLTSQKAVDLRCTYLQPDDVLVARMPDPIGRACIFPGDDLPCVTVVDVCVIRPNAEHVNNRFLMHMLNTLEARHAINRHVTGTTRQRISRKNLSKLSIPLPPLPEQKRIAQILDAADALRAKRRESIAQLDALVQSTFLEMFGDPAVNAKNWPLKPLGDVSKIVTGNTPSRAKQEYYGNELEWIKSQNINTPSFFLTRAEEFLSTEGAKVGRVAPASSVLVTCIAGSLTCIGNAAITDRDVAFNQQINAVIPGSETRTWYIFTLILVGKKLIQDASTNSMKGMVSKSALSAIMIPVPPLELQKKFEIVADSIAVHRSRLQEHIDELNTLFASLQSRAFNGEL